MATEMMQVISQLTRIYEGNEEMRRENEILKSKVKFLEKQLTLLKAEQSPRSTNDVAVDVDELWNNWPVPTEEEVASSGDEDDNIEEIEENVVAPPSPTYSDTKESVRIDETPPITEVPLPTEEEEKALFEKCVKDGKCGCEGNTFKTGKRRGNKPLDLFAFKVHYKKSKWHQDWYSKFQSENVNST